MTDMLTPHSMGSPLVRHDAVAKVTGTAPYAHDHEHARPAHLHPVQSTIARGRITDIDTSRADALDGVLLTLTRRNALRLADSEDPELFILQDDEVAFRGQLLAAVVAETPEVAREAAALVVVSYDEASTDARLTSDREDLYAPDDVNGQPTDTDAGDVETALGSSEVVVDETYTTPMQHNNPMEPHTTVALWEDDHLTLWDSIQGAHAAHSGLAPLLGLDPDRLRVVSPFVGGGFGSKGKAHSHEVLASMAAMHLPGRAVKFPLTRQQMFTLVGHRTPTISHVRLGADRDGRLQAISHDVVGQTARLFEFTEHAAVATRHVYAAPHRRTRHRFAQLDVPVPFWMRAPGECPGMHALEVAMDELAVAADLDPIELRARNDTPTDPESGLPFTHRDLVGCLREGARRFGWAERDPRPGRRREGDWLLGSGVATATYPAQMMPGNRARITFTAGRHRVEIGAADIGTGTWTALAQIAADALECPIEEIDLRIGDSDLPAASVEGGSSGLASWGSTVVAAARAFRGEHGRAPAEGAVTEADQPENDVSERFAPHSFGAQFAEVRVHVHTGEIRVPRMLGVFSVGRIINPRTAHSQLTGGMVMGLSMALHEHSVMDERWGHVVNHDFAEYHVAAHADVEEIDAIWLDETDEHFNPMGARGVGEIGIVGAAAAVANAAHHATGVRARGLPLTPDLFLG